MDAAKRALMNVSGLDILGFFEKVGRWLLRIFLKLVQVVRARNQTQRGRRELLRMSDRMLKDIGISRVDAMQYAKKKIPEKRRWD